MLPLRYRRRWQLISLVILLGVLVAAMVPGVGIWGDKAISLIWFQGIDKWVHGFTFLGLSVWFSGLYARATYWRIGIGLLAFGIVIELCQRMVSYRTSEWFDVAADAAGITVGLLVAVVGVGGWCLQAEEYFARRRSD
jgi:hypothetical protein